MIFSRYIDSSLSEIVYLEHLWYALIGCVPYLFNLLITFPITFTFIMSSGFGFCNPWIKRCVMIIIHHLIFGKYFLKLIYFNKKIFFILIII